MNKLKNPLLIVANADFPKHQYAIKQIKQCSSIIACDGAADILLDNGYVPDIVIGDLDSITKTNKIKFSDRIIKTKDQSENDLRKAINFAIKDKVDDIRIIGATGKREDHTIGNIFSLINYKSLKMKIFTDTGFFRSIDKDQKIKSFKGQQVSIFSLDRTIEISSKHLKYNLSKSTISTLYSGTLNESTWTYFKIQLSHGSIILFQTYK